MKLRYLVYILSFVCIGLCSFTSNAESTRRERQLIIKGNSLYKESKFKEAQAKYEEALKINPSSAEARYNLGLSQIRQVSDYSAKDNKNMAAAKQNFANVAALAKTKPGLAEKANYNLGNIEFNSQDYQKAIEYYKQALRIDPNDDNARFNLRIAQLKLQNKDKDQNKDDKKDQQDQNQQDKEKDKNQPQEQKQDQNSNKQNQNNNINEQTAAQILNSNNKNESAARARYNENKQKQEGVRNSDRRKW